jgi:uncharacterized membrane protein
VTAKPDLVEGGPLDAVFVWRKGVMTTLPAFNNAFGAAINNRGQVVGGCGDFRARSKLRAPANPSV